MRSRKAHNIWAGSVKKVKKKGGLHFERAVESKIVDSTYGSTTYKMRYLEAAGSEAVVYMSTLR